MAMRDSIELANYWAGWKPARGGVELRWGLDWLDRALPEPQPGSLTIVGGETNVGKSFFMLSMLHGAAATGDRGCLYVSLEDPALEVGRRMHAGLAHARLFAALPEHACLSAVLQCIREAGRAHYGWVGVDYLQVMAYDGGVQVWSKADSVSRMAKELKEEAGRAGVALLLASQLRRASQAEANTFPSIHRLKESGDLENMAEYVILLGANSRGVRAEVAKAKGAAVGARQRYTRGPAGVLQAWDGEE